MTGSEIKSVKYNEDLFKIPSGTQKRKKKAANANKPPIKIKPVTNKTIKNKILDEIRKNQEKQYKSLLEEPAVREKGLTDKGLFDNDFQKSVEYMQTFADKHKEETKLNKTLKSLSPAPVSPQTGGGTSEFSETVYTSPPRPKFETPVYGCLKNGKLPTYRTMKNYGGSSQMQSQQQVVAQPVTQQSVVEAQPVVVMQPQVVSQPLVPSTTPFVAEPPFVAHATQLGGGVSRAERIKSPAELLLLEKVKQKAEATKPKPLHKKIKKIMRRTYRTGKDKYRPRVSVLLPNKTIRRNVTTKSYLLKQTPIEEIRKTLLKQGFIKVGSSAPNDVLRKMYESIQMIGGDVNNHNPDNLLYNFFNEKKN